MQQIDFIIKELTNSGDTEKANILRELFNDHITLWTHKFPYFDLFMIPTGKQYGDTIEKRIISSFSDLKKHTADVTYGADCTTPSKPYKIEIKSLRAIKKTANTDPEEDCPYIAERVISSNDKITHFSTSSFQQAKPISCDWFLLHIQYGDKERLFVVPSEIISKQSGQEHAEPHKIPLSKQHAKSTDEGQINLGQILRYADLFEIQNFDSRVRNKYLFTDFVNEISSRFPNGFLLT